MKKSLKSEKSSPASLPGHVSPENSIQPKPTSFTKFPENLFMRIAHIMELKQISNNIIKQTSLAYFQLDAFQKEEEKNKKEEEEKTKNKKEEEEKTKKKNLV
ncbi:hypothetical protein M8J77_018915 [Diaphorina citri]|nr:hypothetical protein M8J77_018915 [Diaphorina citri]